MEEESKLPWTCILQAPLIELRGTGHSNRISSALQPQGIRCRSSHGTHRQRDPSVSFGALEAIQSWATLRYTQDTLVSSCWESVLPPHALSFSLGSTDTYRSSWEAKLSFVSWWSFGSLEAKQAPGWQMPETQSPEIGECWDCSCRESSGDGMKGH